MAIATNTVKWDLAAWLEDSARENEWDDLYHFVNGGTCEAFVDELIASFGEDVEDMGPEGFVYQRDFDRDDLIEAAAELADVCLQGIMDDGFRWTTSEAQNVVWHYLDDSYRDIYEEINEIVADWDGGGREKEGAEEVLALAAEGLLREEVDARAALRAFIDENVNRSALLLAATEKKHEALAEAVLGRYPEGHRFKPWKARHQVARARAAIMEKIEKAIGEIAWDFQHDPAAGVREVESLIGMPLDEEAAEAIAEAIAAQDESYVWEYLEDFFERGGEGAERGWMTRPTGTESPSPAM